MTCAECREAFSARVDDALSADARAALEQHLAGCPECRREWQRFAATVDLLHVVQPERAPAGFVDRVLAAARPQPWYRRALRGLFVPWLVKLPLEAAALVLVAGLAVMIFQRSPELRQAAVSPPAPASAPEPRGYDLRATPSVPSKSEKADLVAAQEGRRETFQYEEKSARVMADTRSPESAPAQPQPTPQQAPQRQPLEQQQLAQQQQQQAEQLMLARRQQQLAESQTVPRPSAEDKAAAPAPGYAEKRADARAKLAPMTKAAPTAPAAAAAPPKDAERDVGSGFIAPGARERVLSAPQGLVASVAAPRVELRLTVADRVAAAREITALVTRLGGTMLPRRDTGGLELTVPREAYPALTRELARVGTLAVVAQPGELPHPVRVGVTLTE
jgi:hypothetical protein